MGNSKEIQEFAIGSGFNFTGADIDELGASEYTLVTIALDESGSISRFETQIRDMLITAVKACANSPRSDNLLIRVIRFGSQYVRQNGNGIDEIHGFKTLAEIDSNNYPQLAGGGLTPLCDAVYSGVGAMNAYAKQLQDMDFDVNGITFVVTDGGENASTATMQMVKDALAESVTGEVMESHVSVLIGIDTGYAGVKDKLDRFKNEAGMTQFIWAGEATKGKLAKLAAFVSQSVSSTSVALGTGGPSQNISATI
ncbi:MAG: hypothetical protein WDZ93_02510 [Candidatus Paceibacterota bacterium]